MSLENRGGVAIALTVGLGAPTTLQFEIGDLDVPDRAGLNEIAFAAVDLLGEVLPRAQGYRWDRPASAGQKNRLVYRMLRYDK
jgi:hypothetical protein